jgi:hypothetical protein
MNVIGMATSATVSGARRSCTPNCSTASRMPTVVMTRFATLDSGNSRKVFRDGRIWKVSPQLRKYDQTIAMSVAATRIAQANYDEPSRTACHQCHSGRLCSPSQLVVLGSVSWLSRTSRLRPVAVVVTDNPSPALLSRIKKCGRAFVSM